MLVGGVAAIAAGFTTTMHESEKRTRAYVEEIGGLRRAVRVLEADLRAGSAAGWRLDEEGMLRRGDVVVARGVGLFEVRREGALFVARVGLRARRETGARHPVVTLRVRPR